MERDLDKERETDYYRRVTEQERDIGVGRFEEESRIYHRLARSLILRRGFWKWLRKAY